MKFSPISKLYFNKIFHKRPLNFLSGYPKKVSSFFQSVSRRNCFWRKRNCVQWRVCVYIQPYILWYICGIVLGGLVNQPCHVVPCPQEMFKHQRLPVPQLKILCKTPNGLNYVWSIKVKFRSLPLCASYALVRFCQAKNKNKLQVVQLNMQIVTWRWFDVLVCLKLRTRFLKGVAKSL